jgi:hypothetical protein
MNQATKVFSGHHAYHRRMRALEKQGFRLATTGDNLAEILRASLELEAAFATPIDPPPVPEDHSYKEVA